MDRNKSENLSREIVEEYYNELFPNTKPSFLINPKTKKRLEIDMYNEKLKIGFEYQGEQHYKPIKFFGGEKKFRQIQKRDKLKRDLCKYYGITLYEIPYMYDYKDPIKLKDYILKLITINNY